MSLAALNARAVANVTARKLSRLAYGYGPALRPSSFEYGVVYWDLEFVQQHISVIQQLLSHPQADSGPHWFPAISPAVAHAFDSIQTILGNLDMRAAGRGRWRESERYNDILENVEDISNRRCGSTLITSAFGGSLVDTFSRLIGEDDWKNTRSAEWWVQSCRDSLVRFEARFAPTQTVTTQPGAPTSGPSEAGPSQLDEVSGVAPSMFALVLI